MVPRKPDWRSYTCNRHVETYDLHYFSQESRTTDENSRVPALFSRACSGLPPALHAYLVLPTAVPGQPRSPLEALPAARAAEASVTLLMDLLVIAEEPGQAEGFPAGVADVPLLLCVDAHVVAQRHVVGVRLVTEGAAEVACLVRVLVVEEAAGVFVGAATEVAGIGALVRAQVDPLHAEAGAVEGSGRGREMLGGAVVGGELLCGCEPLAAAVTLIIHLGTSSFAGLTELRGGVGAQLLLGAEAFPALQASVLLEGKVEAQVVLHS